MSNKRIVLAVDVGFGNTKVVWGAESDSSSEIIYKSIVKRTLQNPSAFGKLGDGIDRAAIAIDGMYYLVGPDAHLAGGVPTIDAEFVTRHEYLALLRGAMYYMIKSKGVVHDIDCLAVGLPVGNFVTHREKLLRVCKGLHTVPTPSYLVEQYGQNITINVKSVLVLPQPLGALQLASTPQGGAIAFKKDDINIVIDPGFNTLDWVVTKGWNMDFERSGSLDGGVSHLLREVADQAKRDLGIVTLAITECEKALDSGILEANGQKYPFTNYYAFADGVAKEIIDRFLHESKLHKSITRIILTGGGAKYYQKALQAHFKGHDVVLTNNSVMANARGFYLWANGAMP